LRETGLVSFRHPQHLLERRTPLADLFLQVRINGDVALFQGLAKAVIEAGAVDEEFVRERTEGFAAYREHLANLNWADIAAGSGLSEGQIREAARLLIEHDRIIVCW